VPEVYDAIIADECARLLSAFFQDKR